MVLLGRGKIGVFNECLNIASRGATTQVQGARLNGRLQPALRLQGAKGLAVGTCRYCGQCMGTGIGGTLAGGTPCHAMAGGTTL